MALIDNIVAYYNFDEASGNLLDQVNNYDGIVTGADYGLTGKINDAYDFIEANSDKVDVADTADLDFGAGAFSINIWANVDATGSLGAGFVTKHVESDPFLGFTLRDSTGGAIALTITGSTQVIGTTDLRGAGWKMITWTRAAGGDNKLYINAVQEGSTVNNTTNLDNSIVLRFGQVAGFGAYLNGLLDEAGIWKGKELSQSEINELYNSGAGLAYPFTVATNMNLNIGDVWKNADSFQINIADAWKDVVEIQQNIGDVWKPVF